MSKSNSLIRFLNLISDINDYNEAKEYLEYKGYDVSKLLREGNDFLESIKAQADLKRSREKRLLLGRAKELLSEKVYENPKEELKRILTDLKPELSVQFSKIEKLDQRDASELLKEEKLLELLNKLEGDDKK